MDNTVFWEEQLLFILARTILPANQLEMQDQD